MSSSALIPDNLKEQIGRDHGELTTLAYNSMSVKDDVTYLPDVKNEIRVTTLKINKIVKPFTTTFSATEGAVEFKPRTVGVKVGKAELSFAPEEYRQTYLGQYQTKGVARSPEDLPFYKYLAEGIFAQFGEEINDETAYFGNYNPAGTSAVHVANGYGKHIAGMITSGDIVPNAIGALNATSAQDQMTALWRSIPEKFKKATLKMTAYMSVGSYEMIQDSLDKKGYNVGRGEEQLGKKTLRGTDNILEVKPVTWMAGSNRVFITPRANILMLADAIEQDLSDFNLVQNMWTCDIGLAAAVGFDFAYGGLIWSNEVA